MRHAVLCLALCLAAPVGAVDMGLSEEADLGPARAAIEAEDWEGALALLEPIVAEDADNADALNLMGYAARNAGDLERAASYYRAALMAEPEHLGALEYQGELFLMQGDRAGAEANLARLTELCGSCEEREELAAALAEGS